MPGRPGTLPWNFATFSGNEPVTTLSDNFNFLNSQINDSGAGFTNYAIDIGTANNLIATLPSAPVAYEVGMMVCTTAANTNTGASVINVNALGNKAIVNAANIALTGGEISVNSLLSLVYDGTSFRILGACPKIIRNATVSTSLTIECAGFTSVAAYLSYTAGAAFSFTLSHLSQGVPVNVTILNTLGGSVTLNVSATDPSGSAFSSIIGIRAGGATGSVGINLITGVTIAAGNAFMFSGMATAPGTLNLTM